MHFVLGALVAGVAFMAGRGRSREQRPDAPPQGRVSHRGAAEHGVPHPGQEQPGRAASPAPDRQREREEGDHRRAERLFWWWSIGVSGLAAVATLAASAFAAFALYLSREAVNETRRQANTAQSQEVRSLRAYVSIEAAPDPELIDGLPGMVITAENVGQTPAYRLHVHPIVTVSGRGDPRPQGVPDGDCDYMTRANSGGLTLARNPNKERNGVGPSVAERGRVAVASGAYEVRASILACYRDVFNAVRSVRMCRRYFNGWNRTITCDGEQDEHD